MASAGRERRRGKQQGVTRDDHQGFPGTRPGSCPSHLLPPPPGGAGSPYEVGEGPGPAGRLTMARASYLLAPLVSSPRMRAPPGTFTASPLSLRDLQVSPTQGVPRSSDLPSKREEGRCQFSSFRKSG